MIALVTKGGVYVNFLRTLCLLAAVCLFAGCGAAEEPVTQIANPWQSFDSLPQAEEAAGFSFGLPPETEDGCTAQQFRVMDGRLLEVIYQQGDRRLTVRKAPGSEDISGDYNRYETVTIAEYANGSATIREDKSILVFTEEYSWSVYCEQGFAENQAQALIEAILKV
jgi:hypothetical protein